MKVLLTGSHFTPALATIRELKKWGVSDIIYIGRQYTMEGDPTPSVESKLLPPLGVKFIPVIAGRLRRTLDTYTFTSLLKIPIGFIQAFFTVLKEKPDVVVSFGGYVGLPVVFAAWLLSIPIIVHEQTLVSGLSNKLSSFFADKIAVSFNKKYDFPKEKIVLTGNPLREDLLKAKPGKFQQDKVILIIGGNQGSHTINQKVVPILQELTKDALVIHQTGDSKFKDYENLVKSSETLKKPQNYIVRKWIDSGELGSILKKASLAVSRAGANTLYELAYFSVPTLAIPLPGNLLSEQNLNAKYFEEAGLVKILEQKDLTSENLYNTIKKMLERKRLLKEEAKKAQSKIIGGGVHKLTQEILLLGEHEE